MLLDLLAYFLRMLLWTSLVLITVLSWSTYAHEAECDCADESWRYFNGSCYYLSSKERLYRIAISQCEENGPKSGMTSIKSPEILVFLTDWMKAENGKI